MQQRFFDAGIRDDRLPYGGLLRPPLQFFLDGSSSEIPNSNRNSNNNYAQFPNIIFPVYIPSNAGSIASDCFLSSPLSEYQLRQLLMVHPQLRNRPISSDPSPFPTSLIDSERESARREVEQIGGGQELSTSTERIRASTASQPTPQSQHGHAGSVNTNKSHRQPQRLGKKQNRTTPELRKQIVDLYFFRNYTANMITSQLGVPNGTIRRIVYLARDENQVRTDLESATTPRNHTILSDAEIEYAARYLCLHGECTIPQLCKVVKAVYEKDVSRTTMARYLKGKHGFRVSDFVNVPKRRNHPDAIQQRQQFCAQFVAKEEDLLHGIFVGVCAFHVGVKPGCGWSLKRIRPVMPTDGLNGKRISLLAAIVPAHGLLFAEAERETVNSPRFVAFLERAVAQLSSYPQRAQRFIFMDNASIHSTQDCTDYYRALPPGISVQFLPPNSCFLNPIDEYFANWKYQFVSEERVRLMLDDGSRELEESILSISSSINADLFNGFLQHSLSFFSQCISGLPIKFSEIIRDNVQSDLRGMNGEFIHPRDQEEEDFAAAGHISDHKGTE